MNSSCICSLCGQENIEQNLLESKIAEIENFCHENGFWISFDKRVNASTTAYLLNVTVETLRNWRYQKSVLPYYQSGKRGTVTYHIRDIAEKILKDKKECHLMSFEVT